MSKWNRAAFVVLPMGLCLAACDDKPSNGPSVPAVTTSAAAPVTPPPPPPSASASASASAAADMKRDRPMHHGVLGMMMTSARALTLKDEQKTALDKIDASLKADEPAGPPAEFKDLHTEMLAEVKAGKIESAKLDPKLAAIEKSVQARQEKEADALNALHAALDPAQRKALTADLRAKMAEREAKMAEKKADKPADAKGPSDWAKKRLERMTKDLDLDDAQQKKVEPLLTKSMPTQAQMDAKKDEMKKRSEALFTAFEADSFDAKKADPPAAAAKKAREPMQHQIDLMNGLLPILKPEQREKLAASMDHPPRPGGMRPGMHGPGMGGPGGPGMGMMWDDPSEGIQLDDLADPARETAPWSGSVSYPRRSSMSPNAERRAYLRALSYRFPSVESALAEVSHLSSVLTLPRGTVHVVSDVHGEFQKLEHILRNGSGSLRPLVEERFADRLDAGARARLLNLIYYPRETFARVLATIPEAAARDVFVRDTLLQEVEILRVLCARYSLRHAERVFPSPYEAVFSELVFADVLHRDESYVRGLLEPFLAGDGGLELVRAMAHTIRSMGFYELIVAGDLGDRGPRLDRVIDALRHQRNISITWGNHDAEWMGACLGQEALVATVVRISLRYGRIAQLEEGYGIPVEPLEQLAREAYGDDPAERFHSKGEDLRDAQLMARMQKAIAILQLKLEGQTTRRNPQFQLEHRNLLHRIDPAAGTVTIDGKVHPLLDRAFPTIDWSDPYRLSEGEARCIAHLRRSFLDSPGLWADMRFVAQHGAMYATRDENLVFHGCVPSDENGVFAPFEIDGIPYAGRALFDACDRVVRRAFHAREEKDVDLLYYLWAGPRSPLFGKDRMATFETYFVADKATYKETKDPYFRLIHEVPFCRSVAVEFGVDPDTVLIVNGHVPVKLEEGESPLKRSKLAVTIDGAFSAAYGDHGFTLVIDADRTYLARHHHFESVSDAIERGSDIVPSIEELRVHRPPRRVGDTPRGDEIRQEIDGLRALVAAYRQHEIEPPQA